MTPAQRLDFNKPAAAKDYRWLHGLNGALLLGLLGFAIGVYGSLPDQVPGHIGVSGVTRWDAKQNSPWLLLPFLALINVVVMYGISAVAESSPGGFNVPAKKRLLTLSRDGQRYAMQPMRGFMYGMATWLLVLTWYMQWNLYRIALAGPAADVETGNTLAVVVLMLAIVIGMSVHLSRRVQRRIADWEQWENASGGGSGVGGAVVAITSVFLAAACGGAPSDRAGELDALPASAADQHADSGDSWAAVRQAGAGAVRVLYVPADGFAYRDADGGLTGVTVEIMRQFGAWVEETHDVSLRLDFVEETDWRTFYGRVRDAAGGVFGVGNVTITEQRREEIRFSEPYLTNVAVLITHIDVPELGELADARTAFSGLDALAFEGTLHEARLRALRDEHLPTASIRMANSNQAIIDGVAAGGHFAWIDAYNYWRALDAGVPVRRHAAGDDPAEEFGVIMPLGSDWAPLLDSFFTRDGGYRESAGYRTLLVRHLGESLTATLEAARRAGAGATSL